MRDRFRVESLFFFSSSGSTTLGDHAIFDTTCLHGWALVHIGLIFFSSEHLSRGRGFVVGFRMTIHSAVHYSEYTNLRGFLAH